jgi:anaerobic magnesium-protoporphyrin IX monomethyl ester cyclase
MNEKVLLINAPSDNRHFTSCQPPLGILYIASFLRQKGIEVSVFDLNTKKGWKKIAISLVSEYRPSIVGISANLSNRTQTYELSALVKIVDKNIIVVVGGPHPSIAPLDFVIPSIDYIIPFEAERTMFNFVCAKDKDNVDNTLSCRKPNIDIACSGIKKDLVANLDELPFPAYDLIDIKDYYINTYKSLPIVSMVTSRGCPQGCIFCSQGVSGRIWRPRTPENIVEEIVWLTEKIGVREISIEDDNFTFDLDRVYKVCDLIRSKGIRITWQLANGIRADKVTKDLLKAMRDAGCWKIAIAPEVGDEESLKKIRKGIELEQFRRVAQWSKELGVVYYGFFLMGFPFQGRKEMEETIRFALELDPLLMDLSKIVPFPGTELFNRFPF